MSNQFVGLDNDQQLRAWIEGTDKHVLFGNRYYENYNAEEEVPGRHRWVDYAHTTITPRKFLPNGIPGFRIFGKTRDEDATMVASRQPWQQPWTENLTGTRGAYKSYNTVAPKLNAWGPSRFSRMIHIARP
ncbi:hypothetical protein B0H12DRAFT_1239419 [Mycena haematopus]|nr:hypothetical protein B0H12DRAFT_1239419 [Mycena haematopus]